MLMTSHLESNKNRSDERKRQLQICFKMMKDAPSNFTVIFGGDLNLRDPEVGLILILIKGSCIDNCCN